jgi:transposase-like protein
MGKKTKTKTGVDQARRRTRAYPHEFRLQVVRLYLEEGYTTSVLRAQFDVSCHSVQRWAKAYHRQGAEGLVPKLPPCANPKITEAIKNRIVGVKTSHPEYGPRRIAAVFRRFFLVSASPTSVHHGFGKSFALVFISLLNLKIIILSGVSIPVLFF